MILDMDVEQVRTEFEAAFFDHTMEVPQYLESKGYTCKKPEEPYRLAQGYIYLVLVPSANSIGLFHQIIIDTRFEDEIIILDPAREGKRRYVYEAVNPNEAEVCSFYIEYVIDKAEVE
tara:strand:- start:4692 stop:5045 length:354 start_codon:yes stop_codon:yes gene_type:complete